MSKPKAKKRKPAEQRYTICSDESGHDYFIPVEQAQAFYKWVECSEDLDYAEMASEELNFDANRIDGRFTFTDPRCE